MKNACNARLVALLALLLLGAYPAAARPTSPTQGSLKVLVLGSAGGSYVCQTDALLAELLARAFGWRTRFAALETLKDEAPPTRGLGPVAEVRRRQLQDALDHLNDWQPDVTLARLPRKDFDALPGDIQNALVSRVRAGMGLVVWATEHGGVDLTGEPIAAILPASGWGGDYTGGVSDATWKWARHRLVFGLPLDQASPQAFFSLTGKATDHDATDLVLTGPAASGRVRVRTAGKGRVVMLGHNTGQGLGPQTYPQAVPPFTMEAMRDRPDRGEAHLRLLGRAVLWSHGERPEDRIAINLPPLPATIPAGSAHELTVQVLNETDRPVKATLHLSVAGAAVAVPTAVTAPPGVSEHKVEVRWPADGGPAWLPLEAALRDGDRPLGSPPAVALRYVKLTGPVQVRLTSDRPGVARGQALRFTATLRRTADPGPGPLRLVWTVNDHQRRALFASEEPITFSATGEASATLRWALPELDTSHYRYIARATVLRGRTILADAILPVFRAERFRLDEGLFHGVWTNLAQYPEALLPSLLDLYADAGHRGVHMALDQFQIYYQEERNWRGYAESFGYTSLADWAELDAAGAQARARKEVAEWLDRHPLGASAAFPVLSLGEEAALTARGAPLCDIPEKDVPKEEYARIRRGYLAYLKRQYGTLEALNAQWQTAYTAWEQVAMPWKYYNFYYPDKQRPDKGVVNVSQAVDQWGFMREVWQRAYDAHDAALREAVPVTRTVLSTGDFYGTRQDAPAADDHGHHFRLDWAFADDADATHRQVGDYLVSGVTMGAYWYDLPLVFNPDLTHTRATTVRRPELRRALEREPLLLHARPLPATREVAVYRPRGPFASEFYSLLQNNLAAPFLPSEPQAVWERLLRLSGVFTSDELHAEARLVIVPLAVTVSEEQARKLDAFVRRGGTLVTTAGLAQYNLRGKPYADYPGAGLRELLGLKLSPDHVLTRQLKWELVAWPVGPAPKVGPLFSTGRDSVRDQRPDVQVLGKYADGGPALLYRRVGRGHVFHFNGVYSIPYTRTEASMPFWPNMGRLVKAWLDLAGVTALLNVLDGAGQPVEELSWNLAGAGTDAPGPDDVRYVRLIGSLTPQPVQVVSTTPIAFARDALGGHPAKVRVEKDRWVVPFTRGPESAHYLALFPYVPAKMTLTVSQTVAGTLANVRVRIEDDRGRLATGRHAVTVQAVLGGKVVTQRGEVRGEGTIALPLAHDDAGPVTVEADDWTAGLRATATVKVAPSPLAAHLPPPLPAPAAGLLPRRLSDDELRDALGRLAAVYARGPLALTCADEVRWRLGYYTFCTEESRHALSARLLAPTPWRPRALRAALEAGARWVLIGEDLGIDRLQGQALTSIDHLAEVAEAVQGATGHAVAGTPDQVVFTFTHGGRLLLDRRSFDYPGGGPSSTQRSDWDGNAVVTRTATGLHTGDSQQFLDFYQPWWSQLRDKGLLGDKVLPGALVPLPRDFSLAAWWREGFPAAEAKAIRAAAARLRLASTEWSPPEKIAGLAVDRLLFADDFSAHDPRWKTDQGRWSWEDGRLTQLVTPRELEEGRGWGGTAILPGVAEPQAAPILIHAVGRITYGYAYGKFGVAGGGTLGDYYRRGVACHVHGTSIVAGAMHDKPLANRPATDLLKTTTGDIAFLLLLDGKTLKAKVWNAGAQPEPPDWQLQVEATEARLGDGLALITDIGGYWKSVRVWRLRK